MKKLTMAIVVAFACLYTATAAAQAAMVGSGADPGFKKFVVGANMSMGMATFVGDVDDAKLRFAGGGAAYFDFYLMPILALEAGIGFVGTGYRAEDEFMGQEFKMRTKFFNMEIPLGVKLNIKGFQASVAVALHFVLAGKTKTEAGDDEDEHKWSGDDWDHFHRANLAPKITLGYAIPVGPVAIVPSVSWFLNLVNEGKDLQNDDSYRGMNIMFNVGAEFGF